MDIKKPLVLAILSGWGIAPPGSDNAIVKAKTPHWDELISEYPVSAISANGSEVGVGNRKKATPEKAYLNLGTGRVCYDLPQLINKSIKSGVFFENRSLSKVKQHLKNKRGNLHLVGSLEGVDKEACFEHIKALVEWAGKNSLKKVYLHLFVSGPEGERDKQIERLSELHEILKKRQLGRVASIIGGMYGLDKDGYWQRTQVAIDAVESGISQDYYLDPVKVIEDALKEGINVREIIAVYGRKDQSIGNLQDNDAVVFFNHQGASQLQMLQAMVVPGWDKFDRSAQKKNVCFLTLTEYERELPVLVAFRKPVYHNPLIEVLSSFGLKILSIADAYRFAHVSKFFNGNLPEPFVGEDWQLVKTFQKDPVQSSKMSAPEITRQVLMSFKDEQHDVIIVNYSNAAVLANKGDIQATIKGCEVVDEQLGKLVDHIIVSDGVLVVVGEGGGAEAVESKNNRNLVPLLVVANEYRGEAGPGGDAPEGDLSLLKSVGKLADVAPTILKIMGIDKPKEMDGRVLF